MAVVKKSLENFIDEIENAEKKTEPESRSQRRKKALFKSARITIYQQMYFQFEGVANFFFLQPTRNL